MTLREYVTKLFKAKEPEPNPQELSMAELCLQYLPDSHLGFGDTIIKRIETFAHFSETLSDEQMYSHLTNNYGLPDKKAQAFVRDSKSYRESMQKFRELGDLVTSESQ